MDECKSRAPARPTTKEIAVLQSELKARGWDITPGKLLSLTEALLAAGAFAQEPAGAAGVVPSVEPFGPPQTFKPKCAECGYPESEHHYNGACYGLCGKFVSKFPVKPAEPSPVEPDPDAPKGVEALPSYWDARRKAQGKPDASRCGAELRAALAAGPSAVDVEARLASLVEAVGYFLNAVKQSLNPTTGQLSSLEVARAAEYSLKHVKAALDGAGKGGG